MRKVLIYGAYGSGNAGDDYMMMVILSLLRKKDIEPVFLVKPVWKHYFGIRQEDLHTVRFPLWADYSHANRVLKGMHYLQFLASLPALRRVDAAILVGGGYTYEKFGNLRRICFLVNFLKKHKIPYYCTGQTVGPAFSGKGAVQLRYIYKNAAAIYVRERFSKECLEKAGISCRLTGDDAFLGWNSDVCAGNTYEGGTRQANAARSRMSGKTGIVVTVKHFGSYERFQEYYFRYIGHVAKQTGEPVRILPFHVDAEEEADLALLDYLTSRGIPAELVQPRDESAFEVAFQKARYVISSAYHAIVLGEMYGCRCRAFYEGDYYRRKLEGITDMYGDSEAVCRRFSDLTMETAWKPDELSLDTGIDFASADRSYENSLSVAKKVRAGWNRILKKME